MTLDVAGFKQAQRKIWSSGDYPDIAQRIESAAERLVAAADVQAGQDVLDVATGSGNVALLAAKRGAKRDGPRPHSGAVRGWAPAGRRGRRRHASGSRATRRPSPMRDGSFDRVLLGVRHDVRAPSRGRGRGAGTGHPPGGTVAVAAWTPEGTNGQMFKTVASHMPAPPPELKPPSMWGNEEYIRALFGPLGVELGLRAATVDCRGRVGRGVARLRRGETGTDGDGARRARAAGQVAGTARRPRRLSTSART